MEWANWIVFDISVFSDVLAKKQACSYRHDVRKNKVLSMHADVLFSYSVRPVLF